MQNEDRLMRDLKGGDPSDGERNGALRSAAKREHELKMKKMLVVCFLYIAVGLAVMLAGGTMLKEAHDVREMLFGAVVIIIGFEITVLIKLGYANVGSLLQTLLATKEVELTLAEILNEKDESES